MVSYPCGRQDVGVWRGQYLTELQFPQVEAYFKPNKLNLLSDCESLKTPDYTMRGSVGPKGYLEVSRQICLLTTLTFYVYFYRLPLQICSKQLLKGIPVRLP